MAIVLGVLFTFLQALVVPAAVSGVRQGYHDAQANRGAPEQRGDGKHPRGDAGNLVRTLRLEVGDCFDDPSVLGIRGSTVKVGWVTSVPCAEPHQWQVFAQMQITGQRYPGAEVIRRQYVPRCFPAFTAYDGAPFARSKLEVYFYYALPESWQLFGDRNVTCFAGLKSGRRLAGSMQHQKR